MNNIVSYEIIFNSNPAFVYIYNDKKINNEKTYKLIIKDLENNILDSASEIKPLWNTFDEMIKEVFAEHTIEI